MFSDRMLLVKNWSDRNYAEKMGLPIPEAIPMRTKLLFYKEDVKRAYVDDNGSIILLMNDGTNIEIEYEERIWKALQAYFKSNDK